MRVIAGDFKGRRLEAPEGKDVRPTTDKVKESLFNLLMNDVYDAVFCDVFAGSGGLGLEAISRGAKKCYFSEASPIVMSFVKKNAAHCGAEDRCVFMRGDYRKNIARLPEMIDVFILDPPYGTGLLEDCVLRIAEAGALAEGGLIVCEHPKHEEMPGELCGFTKVKERVYGTVVLTIYS